MAKGIFFLLVLVGRRRSVGTMEVAITEQKIVDRFISFCSSAAETFSTPSDKEMLLDAGGFVSSDCMPKNKRDSGCELHGVDMIDMILFFFLDFM